jgi:TP901 family phage tail tape measure protein
MAAGINHTIAVLVRGHNALTESLTRAEHSMAGFRKNVESTAMAINNLTPKNVDMSAIDKASDTLKSVGRQAMITGAAMGAGMGLASKGAAGFQTALAEVSTLVDTSKVDMEALGAESKALSAEFGTMPTDTIKSLYTTMSAGFADAADASTLLRGALTLAKAGMADTGVTIDGLTSIMNSYSMKASEVTSVSDQMFIAVQLGKTTIGELASSLGKITPITAGVGIGLDQVLAGVATLTLGGMSTSESVTALRSAINNVIKPTADASETAKKLGINFSTAAIKSMGLAAWLGHVRDKTQGSSDALGKLFGDVQGLAGVMALTGPQADKLNSVLSDIQNSSGATATAFKKVASTAGESFARAKSSVSVLAISIGTTLLPAISVLLNAAADAAGALAKFADAHPILTATATVIAAVSAATLILGGAALWAYGQWMAYSVRLSGVLSTLLIKANALQAAMFAASSRGAVSVAAMSASIKTSIMAAYVSMSTGISGGLTALRSYAAGVWLSMRGAATGAFYSMRSSAIAAFISMQAYATTAALAIRTRMLAAFTAIKGASVTSAFAAVKTALVSMAAGIGSAFTAMGTAARAAWAAVTGPIGLVIVGIAALVGIGYWLWKCFDADGKGISKVWTAIKDTFMGVYYQLVQGVGYLWYYIKGAFNEVKRVTTEVWPYISRIISAAWLVIRAYTLPIASAIAAVVVAAWGVIKTATIFVWDVLKATVVGALFGIYHIIAGVWTLITGMFKAALQIVTGDWSGAWQTIKDTFGGVWEHIKGLFGAFTGWLWGLGNAFADAGKGLVDAFLSGLLAGWHTLKSGFISIMDEIRSYLPGSDAERGPLSQLTASGRAMMPTFAAGMAQSSDTATRAAARSMEGVAQVIKFPLEYTSPGSASESSDQPGGNVIPIPLMQPASAGVTNNNHNASSSRNVTVAKGAITVNVTVSGGGSSGAGINLGELKDAMMNVFTDVLDDLGVADAG